MDVKVHLINNRERFAAVAYDENGKRYLIRGTTGGTTVESETSAVLQVLAVALKRDFNVFQMITTTESVYCLWKILQYLKGIAELEASEDSMEHWRGFLAKSNMKLCRTIMRDKGREYGNL